MHRDAGFVSLLMGLVAVWAPVSAGTEPQLKWEFAAGSNLYAPPLVADIHPSPGKETILSDSEVRRLRCIDAGGKQLWEYDGKWKKRLTSAAALSMTARPDHATLVVGDGDGSLNCIDAATGQELWRKNIGKMEWGGPLWADVNGDGRDEVVAGTEDAGISALDAEGNGLWTYKGKDPARLILVRCPIAAADVDGDTKCEVFAASRFGPVCLNGDGTIRWEALTGDDFNSSIVIGDADHDGVPELYSCASDDNTVFCFDARAGAMKWRAPMAGEADSYASSSLALGDVDQDGVEELVVADASGYVYCISAQGEIRWVFATEKRTYAAPCIGDVDGDGAVEVLAACGDHYLYCVDAGGALKWRYPAGLRLIGPATITDVDGDGKTDILFCGSDKTLRCLTLDGRYVADLIPWPSRRFDVAQSGSSFGKRDLTQRQIVTEKRSVFSFGGFEEAKGPADPKDYPAGTGLYETRQGRPRGWSAGTNATAAWELDSATKMEGSRSLRVTTEKAAFPIATDLIALDSGLQSVDASITVRGTAEARALLRWRGLQGLLQEDALAPDGAGNEPGWGILRVSGVKPPRGAKWLQLVCITQPGASTWWDGAQISGAFGVPATLQVMVNQIGYEIGAPKWFTAQSNFVAKDASFELVASDGHTAFSAPLKHEGRIRGAYDSDWGHEYWRGDFSAFDQAGNYRIRIKLDGATDVSWPFEIAKGLLWDKTSRLAYRFFYYQRCGADVPGFHKACHLDDAVSADGKRQYELWGGWHDAGDYNTYDNTPYVLRLAVAYGIQKEAFDQQDVDANGSSDLLDEILWGGAHSRRMMAPDGSAFGAITSGYGFWGPPELETDNIPGTGDERPITGAETGNDSSQHAAAMARIACYVTDKAPWVEAAERGLKRALANNARGPLQFSAALDLYAATKNEKYAALAKELFPGANVDVIESIRMYDTLFHEDHSAHLREALVARAEKLLELAQNPFGLCAVGPKEKMTFFGTPPSGGAWHVGTNSHILDAANAVALAYQYNPDPRYLAFVYDQFNWVLGNNPYNISLMEGAGSAFAPTYHHRYTFSGVARGAVPGGIVNGITWQKAGSDRPCFDMRGLDIPSFESNEVWLPHNTAYLNALANLRRCETKE